MPDRIPGIPKASTAAKTHARYYARDWKATSMGIALAKALAADKLDSQAIRKGVTANIKRGGKKR